MAVHPVPDAPRGELTAGGRVPAGRQQAPAIALVDAAASLGGRRIWEGVSLTIEAGDFVAVLGPNGVGKSTLLRVVLGMVPLARGSVEVFGQRPRGGARVGYLPQRRSFEPSLRIRARDVARLGLDGARWGVPIPFAGRLSARRRAEEGRLEEVLDLVGASGYADRPVGELSGGEQQRVLIARALGRRPRLLLLDEPLEGLDLGNQQAISGLANRICREEGVTVVMVAHDVNPILADLDQVLYVAGGGAVMGRPEEVITTETLSALYSAPIEVLRTAGGQLVVVGHPDAVSFHGHR
jgi:zinc/manganese transport system ATP-binding protein